MRLELRIAKPLPERHASDVELPARDGLRRPAARQRARELVALDRLQQRVAQRRRPHRMGAHAVRAPADRRGAQRRSPARRTIDGLRRDEDPASGEEIARGSPGDARRGGPEPRRDEVLRLPCVRQIARGCVDQVARTFRRPKLRRFGQRGSPRLFPRLTLAVANLQDVAERTHRARDLDAGAVEARHARDARHAEGALQCIHRRGNVACATWRSGR